MILLVIAVVAVFDWRVPKYPQSTTPFATMSQPVPPYEVKCFNEIKEYIGKILTCGKGEELIADIKKMRDLGKYATIFHVDNREPLVFYKPADLKEQGFISESNLEQLEAEHAPLWILGVVIDSQDKAFNLLSPITGNSNLDKLHEQIKSGKKKN